MGYCLLTVMRGGDGMGGASLYEVTQMTQGWRGKPDARIEFICAAGGALLRYGARTDRLEHHLEACGRALGIEAEIYMLPNAIFATFGGAAQARTVIIETEEETIDLRGLAMVGDILDAVTNGGVSAEFGLAQVRLITTARPRFRWYYRVPATGLSAAAVAVLIGGGPRALVAAAMVGIGVGSLLVIGRKSARLIPLLEFLAGVLSVVLTAVLWHVLPHFALDTVILAGVTPLIPGLTITKGVSELAAKHVVSGAARLASAAIVLVTLVSGIAMATYGLRVLNYMPPKFTSHGSTSLVLMAISTAAGAAAFMVLMNARPKDFPVILTAWVVALGGIELGVVIAGPTFSVVVAALLLGVFCNLYGWITGLPSAIPRVPGLVVLVPGAIGFRSATSLLDGSRSGAEIMVTVVIVGVGLVVGLLLADSAVPLPAEGRRGL